MELGSLETTKSKYPIKTCLLSLPSLLWQICPQPTDRGYLLGQRPLELTSKSGMEELRTIVNKLHKLGCQESSLLLNTLLPNKNLSFSFSGKLNCSLFPLSSYLLEETGKNRLTLTALPCISFSL